MQQRRDLEESTAAALRDLHDQCIAQMQADEHLTENQRQELLRQLDLPEDQWESITLPDGDEPVSETIIKMRRERIQ